MSQSLDSMILTLRALGGRDLVNEIAKEAAPLIDQGIRATAKAGQTPDGQAWAPRKKDGAQALQGVEGDITTTVHGDIVRSTLTGGGVYAHTGARGPQRQVLPSGGAEIPPQVTAAIIEAAGKVFDRMVRL